MCNDPGCNVIVSVFHPNMAVVLLICFLFLSGRIFNFYISIKTKRAVNRMGCVVPVVTRVGFSPAWLKPQTAAEWKCWFLEPPACHNYVCDIKPNFYMNQIHRRCDEHSHPSFIKIITLKKRSANFVSCLHQILQLINTSSTLPLNSSGNIYESLCFYSYSTLKEPDPFVIYKYTLSKNRSPV